MNLLTKLIFIISLCISLNAKVEDAKFGFETNGSLLSPFKNAKLSLKVWIKNIASKYDINLDIVFFDSAEDMYNSYSIGELDMAVSSLSFFFQNKKDILKSSDTFWSATLGEELFSQYYLIAKKSLNAKGFIDIKNKTLSLENNNNGSFIWLDKNSLIYNKKSSNIILKKIFVNKNDSTSLLNVFFNKSDFAIVRKETWDIAIELNPSLTKKLEIIKKSEKSYLSFIGFFRKNGNKKVLDAFFKLNEDLKGINQNEHVRELLRFNSIYKVDVNSLKNLAKYYEEYFVLKKRYK